MHLLQKGGDGHEKFKKNVKKNGQEKWSRKSTHASPAERSVEVGEKMMVAAQMDAASQLVNSYTRNTIRTA